MSKVSALYHLVFCTKCREMTLSEAYREDLYRFIWSIIKDHRCVLLRIGGISNHIHILLNLHPSVALADLMKEIKSRSSNWMKHDGRFPLFRGWAQDYFGCSVSAEQKYQVISYIRDQQLHHGVNKLEVEIEKLYISNDQVYDARDMYQ